MDERTVVNVVALRAAVEAGHVDLPARGRDEHTAITRRPTEIESEKP